MPKRPDDARLRLLARVAERILSEPALSEDVSYTINFDSTGITHEVKEPGRQNARSLLMEVRKLDQPREDLFLPEIIDIIAARVTDPLWAQGVADARTHYTQMQTQGAIQLADNDGPISPRTAFELWAYGEHIHDDEAKASRMERMDEHFRPLVRHHALEYVDMLARIAAYLVAVLKNDPAFAALGI